MDKYLLEILKEVNTIIIPSLGALTITNADKGEIMFMPYLKHDDGKLTSYISKNEGIDENEAMNLISKYVREIQIELDKGESYDMYKFGSFYKNDHEIDFKSWSQMNEGTSVEKETEAVKKEELKKAEDENILTPSQTVIPEVKEEELENKELNILEKEEREATLAKLDELRKEQEENSKKKRRGVGFYRILVLISLLVGGGVFFGLNYKKHLDNGIIVLDTKNEKQAQDYVSNTEIDSIIVETGAKILNGDLSTNEESLDIELKDSETLEKDTNSNIEKPYHIIAGAFTSERYANRLGDKLRSEGYTIKIGRGRGMMLVSVKSFPTIAEAKAELVDLKSVAPKGWVYKW